MSKCLELKRLKLDPTGDRSVLNMYNCKLNVTQICLLQNCIMLKFVIILSQLPALKSVSSQGFCSRAKVSQLQFHSSTRSQLNAPQFQNSGVPRRKIPRFLERQSSDCLFHAPTEVQSNFRFQAIFYAQQTVFLMGSHTKHSADLFAFLWENSTNCVMPACPVV